MATTQIVKLQFDADHPDAAIVVNEIVLTRLRHDPSFTQTAWSDPVWERLYVEFQKPRDREAFGMSMLDALWDLIRQGVISPGLNTSNPTLPHFHLTDYGRRVLAEPHYSAHDPEAYIRQLGQTIANPDATVLAYLRESLVSYTRGTVVASVMMLGIAAERAFLLVCDSLLRNLRDPAEQARFQKLLGRNPIKPKLGWVTQKFQQIQYPKSPPDWPEDIDIKVTGIFNLIRCQRNELGHPRPAPPAVTRDDAFSYLRIFPSYYGTAEQARTFLANNKV